MKRRNLLKSKNFVMQCMDMKSVQNVILQMLVFGVSINKKQVINVIYVATSGPNHATKQEKLQRTQKKSPKKSPRKPKSNIGSLEPNEENLKQNRQN